MQLASVWPPRRAVDRLVSELHYRRTPGIPWLPREAIGLLPDLLRTSDSCLEWGAGISTAWFGERVGSIVGVEHDRSWFDRATAEIARRGLGARASVRLLSIEPRDQPAESPYVRVIDEYEDEGLDVCVIDGEHRAACAHAALPKLRRGGLLIIDDAQDVFDHPTRSPHARFGQGPPDADWARFAELVAEWRLLYTSDGFSDAAIWFKP